MAKPVIIVGGGVGGLTAAALLAARGEPVILLERAASPGGKIRQLRPGGAAIDAGPTVLTMRWVFEEIFAAAGASLGDRLLLRPADILARHAWGPEERLDLFADPARSAEAVGELAGAEEARRFLAFCGRAKEIYETLEGAFLRAARPDPLALVRSAGLQGLGELWRIRPFDTLWQALGDHFHDSRLRQLFGRYATYCGSSPFQAPATLMLVAHVEQEGVWLVEGGMQRLAEALAGLASAAGAELRCHAEVREVLVEGGRAAGVRLADGERLDGSAVIFNGDSGALSAGLLGRAAAAALPAVHREPRSLSALTWALVAVCEGFPLSRHNVFFSDDYEAEFEAVFRQGRLPTRPTVYVCAQDRDDQGRRAAGTPSEAPERLLCLVNAPALGDRRKLTREEIESCESQAFALLRRCGLTVRHRPETTLTTAPADWERLFPGTGGALYGPASHGWRASFRRPAGRTRLPGLYLAGGSVHPGPGVPMAALSGRTAAALCLQDRASTSRSRPMAMSGGTSTR